MNTPHTIQVAIEFNQVFRSWLVKVTNPSWVPPHDPYRSDTHLGEVAEWLPRLIIKTGFLKPVGSAEWPLHLHNFIVYDGYHTLLGTLEPRLPLADGSRTFLFHRHSRNDDLVMPGAYRDMDGVIFDLLDMQRRGELAKP